MNIEISLIENKTIPNLPGKNYDPELDDIRSILIDVCEALSNYVQFNVSGFGQDNWPVDVATDLAVFLEQLPYFMIAISAGENFELQFYEQGIERSIFFSRDRDDYIATCVSHTAWIPNPNSEKMSWSLLLALIYEIKKEFVFYVKFFFPKLHSHSWFEEWKNMF